MNDRHKPATTVRPEGGEAFNRSALAAARAAYRTQEPPDQLEALLLARFGEQRPVERQVAAASPVAKQSRWGWQSVVVDAPAPRFCRRFVAVRRDGVCRALVVAMDFRNAGIHHAVHVGKRSERRAVERCADGARQRGARSDARFWNSRAPAKVAGTGARRDVVRAAWRNAGGAVYRKPSEKTLEF